MCAHKPKTVSGRLREISNVEVIDVEQISPFPSICMHVEGSRWSSGRSDPKVTDFMKAFLFLVRN